MDNNKFLEINVHNISQHSDVNCYSTVMSAKDIYEYSTISRANDDDKNGYQRILSETRVKDIKQYLEDGNIIPGAIILSVQKDSDIKIDNEKKLLTIFTKKNKLFIVDGQHRVYGVALCSMNIEFPVCIFTNLTLNQEVQYFLDINSNQKGVPKALRIELLKFLSEPDSKDDIRAKLFKELGEDPRSPLYGRISTTSSVVGKISHVPFKEAIDPILDKSTFKNMGFDNIKKLILNYLNAVNSVLEKYDDTNRLTRSAFFQAIFKAFELVCTLSLFHFQNYKEESFYALLLGIKSIDFENHNGSNQQAIANLSKEIMELISVSSRKLTTQEELLF